MTGAVPDLTDLGSQVEWTDAQAASDARDAASAAAGLGGLDDLREWLAATSFGFPPEPPRRPWCAVVGPVPEHTRLVADQVGCRVEALDVPEPGSAAEAFDRGVAEADARVDEGCDLLVVADPDPSPSAALLVSVLGGLEPVALLPRGAHAVDTERWIARAEALRDQRRGLLGVRGRPGELLDALEQPSLAATTGLILRAAARRTPLVLDGAGAAAAALLCHDVQARTGRWWRFADRSPDPVHSRVLHELGAIPVLDLGTSAGDGVAGLLTLPLLRAATVTSR
ncbi:nicotinate-nucleotide--dimethylbenzimidazole phosphoribosyltransferase [Jatrophihabitans endophyticus]|uniref:nicotinate-nucleotide--dimethylbenzimidazole phosphoribosyltransferase n=1 Tax=Jatrophihabitans endophyticus TaxID=1206085 RepID=UPI0019E298FA|nr:nicotinate-nucleotide--dimethylbenzimidazole phosphoribosyltransferase [Jatrophihabitans endophyticus]MBE7186827.1 nicotinate-nucleotide--dimethylbenzimidazole phosphoribosyltransferase [Jatrophihabitans endophyticus]